MMPKNQEMVTLINFETHQDDRGSLVAIESSKNIPFDIKRIYYLFKNNPSQTRAKHAHKKLKQVYIAMSGSCKISLDDGEKQEVVTLDKANVGMLFNGLVWREIFDFSEDCVLMVLADEFYEEEDYLKTYEEFLEFRKLNNKQ